MGLSGDEEAAVAAFICSRSSARSVWIRSSERLGGGAIQDNFALEVDIMAALRWAVIALQQAQRHHSGEQPSLELALTGRMVAEMELEILEGTLRRDRTGAASV